MSSSEIFLNGGASSDYDLQTGVDVLVIGGGPAGAWAAIRAAAAGSKVVLADKGYCGASGATAPSGTGVWYVPPDAEQRRKARDSRDALGGFLADHRWVDRVLDQTYESLNQLADWGYPFPTDDNGQPVRGSLQGPEYMRLMRRRVERAGVRILDHSPALELLVDADGVVSGAAGYLVQQRQTWAVRAGAVVLATGGCAFLSKALGTNVLTGDGYLLAAEAGAELSGMEFSNAYGLGPKHSSSTKSAFFKFATFYYEDGEPIPGAGSQHGRSVIARTIQEGRPVYCILDRVSDELKPLLRGSQPNFFISFDRIGVDPFTQPFEVSLRLEGTVRGTGGIHIVNDFCATSVPGLYAAGDAATRELICGGFTGGGSHNAAWAISSGQWAGAGAASFARSRGLKAFNRDLRAIGGAGLRPSSTSAASAHEVVEAVQAEVFPFDRNLFRTESGLAASTERLNSVWSVVRDNLKGSGVEIVRVREAAAMAATARWMYATAQARRETRGMHKRVDFPRLDSNQHYRLVCGGLDDVWVRPETVLREAIAS
jgi:succinate dehydrogenase/fumarate reductase flavoprotein subunit